MYLVTLLGLQALLAADPVAAPTPPPVPPYDITVHYPQFALDHTSAQALVADLHHHMGLEAEVVMSAVRHDFGLDIHTYLSLTEMARVHCIIHEKDPPPCLPHQCLALERPKVPGCLDLASDPETFTLIARPPRVDLHTGRPLAPCSHCEEGCSPTTDTRCR